MSKIMLASTAILLFVFMFIVWYGLIRLWLKERNLRTRLSYRSAADQHAERKSILLKPHSKFYRHLSDLLEAMRIKLKPAGLLVISWLLLLTGLAVGIVLFQTIKGALMLGVVLGLLPYTIIRAMLTHRRMQTQMDFLPAVELFYQCYLVTGERQVRIALQRTIEEHRLIGPMQAVFEQLYRNLSVRGDDEGSLRIMAASLGHIWADYFVNILRVSLAEGVPISDSLRELLADMRKARRSNEQERNRLLEIRIANFTPILFLVLFIGINLRYNKDNAYYYYWIDPQGRDLLLNAFVLIFASFLMGLWLSRKKM